METPFAQGARGYTVVEWHSHLGQSVRAISLPQQRTWTSPFQGIHVLLSLVGRKVFFILRFEKGLSRARTVMR